MSGLLDYYFDTSNSVFLGNLTSLLTHTRKGQQVAQAVLIPIKTYQEIYNIGTLFHHGLKEDAKLQKITFKDLLQEFFVISSL